MRGPIGSPLPSVTAQAEAKVSPWCPAVKDRSSTSSTLEPLRRKLAKEIFETNPHKKRGARLSSGGFQSYQYIYIYIKIKYQTNSFWARLHVKQESKPFDHDKGAVSPGVTAPKGIKSKPQDGPLCKLKLEACWGPAKEREHRMNRGNLWKSDFSKH